MSAENAVKGLAVLTAIPVVVLALWAEYFGQRLTRLEEQNPHYDRATEHVKLRLAGLVGMFFQFGIFLGSAQLRKGAPVTANLIFVAAIILQSVIQAAQERKLRKPKPSLRPATPSEEAPPLAPGQEMGLALRAFLWSTVGGALYLAGFTLPVVIVSLASKHFHASAPVLTGVLIASAVFGMIAGVGINFALGAFYLRRMLPAREITDGEFKSRLEACFDSAGLRSPSLWVIETGRSREATAMMAGFPWGRGFFRPGLFLSRALVEGLTPDELRAVVLHEVSHLKLQHLRKRLFYSVSLVIATTAAATFCVFLASVLMPGSGSRDFIGFAAAATALILTFRLLSKQSRAQELEADVHSVQVLLSGMDDLASALRKLDRLNGRISGARTLAMRGHPSTEHRIEALRMRFEAQTQETGDKDTDRAA